MKKRQKHATCNKYIIRCPRQTKNIQAVFCTGTCLNAELQEKIIIASGALNEAERMARCVLDKKICRISLCNE